MRPCFDVLSFRTTVSPWLLRVFGGLVTRVIFERAILAFQTYERLNEIAGVLAD